MALTAEEKAELESLKGDNSIPPAAKASGLSDSEAEELKALQKDKSISPEEKAKFQKGQDISDAMLKGVTSGTALEGVLGGAIQSGLDLGQQGLNKLGLASPSPTQVNAKLATQGATGDIGPTNDKDLYYEGKHQTQADFDKAQAKYPLIYGASQLVGGMALGALPLGAAAKGAQGATMGIRAINAAKAAAPIGAAVGAGAGFLGGKSDLAGPQANPLGVAKETATGGAIGAGIGALGGAGVQALSELPIASTLSKFANNRAGAAANVNPKINNEKQVGQALLDNNTLPTFGGVEGIKKGVQNKINSLEDELQPILKNASDTNVPTAKSEEATFLEKLKSYKKFLDAKKGLDKHTSSPLPAPTTMGQDAQAAMPSAIGDVPPVSSSQLSPPTIPNVDAPEGAAGGLDQDTVNQLRQQMGHPIDSQHVDVTGEYPGSNDLAEQLHPPTPNPMQAGGGESTPLLPSGNPQAPVPPTGVVTKEKLLNQFDDIIRDATKGFNQTPEDIALAQKLTEGLDKFKQQIVSAGNDPMALNEIKRRLYQQIKEMNKSAYTPGNESIGPKIEVYKNIANLLKNQIEGLVDVISPGMGNKVKNINNEYSKFISADQGLNKIKDNGINPTDFASPVKNMVKAVMGRPADIASAKAANALSKINPTSALNNAQAVVPALEQKTVQKNIYNQDRAKYANWATKLAGNPNTSHIGAELQRGIDNNDSLAINRANFLIQQTPAAKKAIEDNSQ